MTGLVLGDGHICKHPRTESLQITLGTDKPELIKLTRNVVERIFDKSPSVYKAKNGNWVQVVMHQKFISKRLKISSGNKSYKEIKISKWITDDTKFLVKILSGLFEAEASYNIHPPTCTYNLSFHNKNISLLNFVEGSLINLGFHPERREFAVRLRKKHEATNFVKLISFRDYV